LPVGGALAYCCGFGAVVGAGEGVFAAEVADGSRRSGRRYRPGPLIAQDRGGVEVDAEPGQAADFRVAIQGAVAGEFGAEGEGDAVTIGDLAERGQGAIDTGGEGGIELGGT